MMIYQKDGHLYRRYDKEILCIEPYGKNALRIRATQRHEFADNTLSALLPDNGDHSDCQIVISDDTATITNGAIRCEILCTGKLKFYNKNKLVLEGYDKDRGRKNAPGEYSSALQIHSRTFIPYRGTESYYISQKFEADNDEKFYGMGQYSQPFLDLKGCNLELAQRNSQISIPFVYSNRGYGLLWNNPAIGHAVFSKNYTEWTSDSSGQIDYWITVGDTPSEVLKNYADATGHVPMMPQFGLGFWQSKLRYYSQDEVLRIAREYKKRGLPLSVIVIDFFHWTAQGDWKFDPFLWPDPRKMVEELHKLNVEVMVSVWPTVEEKSENYKYLEEMGFLVRTDMGPRLGIKNKDTYFDATNPDARSFVWSKLKKNYYDYGIHLFWLDECEPEYYRYEYDNYRYYLGSDKEVGNLYPLKETQMVYEGRKAEGENDIISLCRSAWAGSQKYGALVWTGDIASNFESLRNQLAAGLNMGMSGMPWWTTDVGGFHEGDPKSEYFKECFVRWFEFGCFCPVFRLHGNREPKIVFKEGCEFKEFDGNSWKFTTGSPNEVWSFGDAVYAICKKYLSVREALKPYIEKLMSDAHEYGYPVMRTMFFEFPEDEKCWEIEDQYMFGPDLLVAPVFDKGIKKRSVYFPKGQWDSIYTGEKYEGGKIVECDAPLDIIPLFIISSKKYLEDSEITSVRKIFI